MRENKAKQLLKAGKPAIGMWLSIPSQNTAEALATVGWDWLTLDVEHACFNPETQQSLFLAIASHTIENCLDRERISSLSEREVTEIIIDNNDKMEQFSVPRPVTIPPTSSCSTLSRDNLPNSIIYAYADD